MTMPAMPAHGASWDGPGSWGAAVTDAASEVIDGRLTDAALKSVFGAKPGTRTGLRRFSGMVPFGPRATAGSRGNSKSGASIYRAWVPLPSAIGDVQLVFSNLSDADAVGANDITVRASIEYPAGTFIPLYFEQGRDVVIKPGAFPRTVPVGLNLPKTAGGFWVRTYSTPASSGIVTTNAVSMTAVGEGYEDGGSDKTTTGTVSATYGYAYGPSLILGSTPYTLDAPILGGLGDSIMDGLGDGPLDLGFLSRAAWGQLHMAKWGVPGQVSSNVVSARYRSVFMDGVSDMVFMTGTNDLANVGLTLAQAKTDFLAMWQQYADRGARVYACTIAPRVTTTDGLATTANQTPYNSNFAFGSSSLRAQLNDWIRSVPAPLAGYFETADTLETGRNSGYWNSTTGDGGGTHPGTAGYVAMAAAINLNVFRSNFPTP